MEKEERLSLKTKILFFVLTLCFSCVAIAQNKLGDPLVTNYHSTVYKGYSQNWDICVNSRGIMFFANGDGVIIYDGNTWQKIMLTNTVPASVVYCDKNDFVWVGGQSELGVLVPDVKKLYNYVSLKGLVPEKYKNFNFITQIIESSDGIYFKSGMLLFRYHNGQMNCLPIESSSFVFKVEDKPMIFSRNQGFFLISGNRLLKVRSTFPPSLTLRSMLHVEKDTFLFVDQKEGLFYSFFDFSNPVLPSASVVPFDNPANDFLRNNSVFSAKRLSNGNFAFATNRDGTLITDENFNIIYVLNKKSGVMNETHTTLLEDSQRNLWIALDNGISKVNLGVPLASFGDNSGVKGSALDVCRFNNKMLVATWQGVFCNLNKNDNSDEVFSMLDDNKSQTWAFNKIRFNNQNYVLFVSGDGLFAIDSNFRTQKIIDGNFSYVAYDEKNRFIYAASQFDVTFVKIKSSFADVEKMMIPKIYSHITGITMDKYGRLVVGTTLNGVYVVNPVELKNSKRTDFQILQYVPGKQLPKSDAYFVYNYEDQIVVVTKGGMYKLLDGNKMASTNFDHVFDKYFDKYRFISIISSNAKGDIWFQEKSLLTGEKKVLFAKKRGNSFDIYDKPFKLFPNVEFYNIYPENNKVVWFCGDDGVYRYDYSNVDLSKSYPFNTILRGVTIDDSVIYSGIFGNEVSKQMFNSDINQVFSLGMNVRNIRFDFASNFFADEKLTEYSFYLEGLDSKWSDPSLRNFKEYANLRGGEYAFHLKAINPCGGDGDEIVFRFIIPTPWYLKWWAFAIYFIALSAVIILIIFIVNLRLIRAKTRLESIIHRRTMEVNNQKRVVEVEKEKADQLLLNILPVRVAEDLKNLGQCQTEYYNNVTVLFTDFSNFTSISEKSNPSKLVSKLDEMFIRFDEICSRHKMEKIKTIGDSHMSVGGIPVRNRTHPIDAVLAALEMQQYMAFIQTLSEENKVWKLRIGVNTGEIISGVVGKRKFAFDVWGDTVNTASRFQDAGECGKVNISKSTAEAVKDFFDLQYRGIIPIKHKGEVDMYFVTSIKKELSVNGLGEKPNSAFWEKYNDYVDLKYLDF